MIRKRVLPAGHKWWKGRCHTKAAYSSEKSARNVGRNRLSYNEPGSPDRLWPYACPGCRMWHLTRQDNNEAAITRREMWEGTGL